MRCLKNTLLAGLLLPAVLTSTAVVSTEQDYQLSNARKHDLRQMRVAIQSYWDRLPEQPNLYQAVMTFTDANLTQPLGQLAVGDKLVLTGLYYNEAGQAVFQLKDDRFILADASVIFDDQILETSQVEMTLFLTPGFQVISSPIEVTAKPVKHQLSAYTKVKVTQLATTPLSTFAKIDKVGWVDLMFLSDYDNRLVKVQELLDKKYKKSSLGIYVQQLETGLTAGVNQERALYSASLSKLPILYYIQHQLDAGKIKLTDTYKYSKAVNEFKGHYEPAGSGSLPKLADNQTYKVADLLKRTAQQSDNVGSNLLAYYGTHQYDADFQAIIKQAAGGTWDMVGRKVSPQLVGQLLATMYNQDSEILKTLSQTDFDGMRIAKDLKVRVAHKIGDAYDFRHDAAIVYADSPFILVVMTEGHDDAMISRIANDIYGILK